MREQVLDAAAALLSRADYRNTSLDDVACYAGVRREELRVIFRSKEDVFLSVLDRVAEDWIAYMQVLSRTERPVLARMRHVLVLRVLFRYDRLLPIAEGFSQMMTTVRTAHLARSVGHFEREAKVFSGLIEEASRDRILSTKLDANRGARTLILATNSLLPHGFRERDWSDRNALERSARAVAHLLVRGLPRARKTVNRRVPDGLKKTARASDL